MKFILVYLMLIGITSCSLEGPDGIYYFGEDSRIIHALEEFHTELERREGHVNRRIIIRDTPTFPEGINLAGKCRVENKLVYGKFHTKYLIWIKIEDFTSYNKIKEVLFHELGHCLYDLNHVDDYAIMSKYIVGFDETTWIYVVNKFFDKAGL